MPRYRNTTEGQASLAGPEPASIITGPAKEVYQMPRRRKLPDGMVTRPGRRGYYADFRVGGRRVQKKLGTDFDAAKSILHELRARAEKGGYGLLDNDYTL